MNLSDRTLQLLKNFAAINPNLVVNPGQELKTMSVAKTLLGTATVTETFPTTFGIYDLYEFLNVLNLVDDPNLTFQSDHVIISDSSGRSSVKYFFSDPDMLTVPSKGVEMPEAEVNFVLDTRTLSSLKSAASALGHSEVSIRPGNGSVTLQILDTKNATSNTFSVDVEGSYDGQVDFNFVLNVNNLKVVNEDFDVAISSKLISHFKSKQSAVEYFIALEKTSTYGAQ
jgi:hypothetical protein